jgi:hypothetical protein
MASKDKVIPFLLALMSLFYLASGVALYFFPLQTYETLPGYYGAFNNHFIKDAGLAFSSSGIMLALALFRSNERFIYSFCAALFVVLHALFHIQMLLTGMVPPEYTFYELLQVIIPAFVVLVLVGVIYGKQQA